MSRCRKDYDYKTAAIKAAKDFSYGEEVIKQIEECDNDDKIADIMAKARHAKFK